MTIRRDGSAARPTSIIGRWLRADIRGDKAAKAKLPDDPADEDAQEVMRAAFELAVLRRFRPDCSVRDITLLVAGIKRRYQGQISIPVREAEALIREQLGETMPTNDINATDEIFCKGFVLEAIVEDLGLFDSELDALLAEAERMAVERGFRPTPAPPG